MKWIAYHCGKENVDIYKIWENHDISHASMVPEDRDDITFISSGKFHRTDDKHLFISDRASERGHTQDEDETIIHFMIEAGYKMIDIKRHDRSD